MPAVKQHELVDRDSTAEIIDIRSDAVEIDLKNEVKAMIGPKEGPRMLPTLLLYDEKGLQLFEDVCPHLVPGHGQLPFQLIQMMERGEDL